MTACRLCNQPPTGKQDTSRVDSRDGLCVTCFWAVQAAAHAKGLELRIESLPGGGVFGHDSAFDFSRPETQVFFDEFASRFRRPAS